MFERASQVNARFAAGTSQPREIVTALEELGLTTSQITVLERTAPAPGLAATARPSIMTRLRGLRAGQHVEAPRQASAPDLQIIVHMGQDDTLAEPVQEVFRRFGAAGIEHFSPTHTPHRAFGPTEAGAGGHAPE